MWLQFIVHLHSDGGIWPLLTNPRAELKSNLSRSLFSLFPWPPFFISFFDYQSTHGKQKKQRKIKSFPILMISSLSLFLIGLSSKRLVMYIEIPRILTCIWFILFHIVMEIWTQNTWQFIYYMDQQKIRWNKWWHLWKLKYSQTGALC